MEKRTRQTVKKHAPMQAVFVAGLTMVFLLSVSKLVIESYQYVYEYYSDREDWLVYNSVEPLKDSFAPGEAPAFVSDATYRRDLDIRWQDTLWCRQDNGIKKYPTQYYPPDRGYERKSEGNTLQVAGDDIPFWQYLEAPIDPQANECKMNWKAITLTPHGHEKIWAGATDWFKVNVK